MPAAFLSFFLAAFFAAEGLSAQADSVSRAQADAYLSRAQAALAAGTPAAAAPLIESALSLAPGYPEALYLRALSAADDRGKTRAAREDLRRAVAAADWQRTDPDEAALALGETLVRTAQLSEAEPILRRLVRERPESPRALLALAALHARRAALAASAEARRQSRVQEQALLVDGGKRFPRQEEFSLRLSRSLEISGSAAAARKLIASALQERPDSLPLWLRAAELETRAVARLKAAEKYLAAGGMDPRAATLALESKPADPAGALARFVGLGGLSRVDLTERVFGKAAATRGLATALARELARYTGVRDLDRDGDGYWDERWQIESGSPVSWVRDVDQDGVPELRAAFTGGQPARLESNPGGEAALALVYSRYPSLHSMEEPAAGGLLRTALLAPFSLAAPFLAKEPAAAGMVARVVAEVALPSRARLASAAWRLEERRPGTAVLVRRTEVSRGLPSYTEEDLDGDGRIDHRLWYRAGSPERGERDLAGDGVFEARETWTDGVLQKTTIDTDGDGKPDFTELAGSRAMRLWDYDGDGRDDSRESRGADGSVVREFSTAMDGRFDLRVVFRTGRIVSLQRKGKDVPVKTLAAGGVTWIGVPGPAGALGEAPPDGYHSAGGRRWLVFRHDGLLYAEELP